MYEDGSLYIPHERLNITDKNTYKVNLLLAMGTVFQVWWDNVSICFVYYEKDNFNYSSVNIYFPQNVTIAFHITIEANLIFVFNIGIYKICINGICKTHYLKV